MIRRERRAHTPAHDPRVEVDLLGDGSHGDKLGLGALLGANVSSALLLGGQLAALLLEHDLADSLALDSSQLLALGLEDLEVVHVGRRLHHHGGRRGAGAGDAVAVVVEGVRQEEVVVGEERSSSLLAAKLGQRLASGPRGECA